jgi:hypothetical protein
MAVRVESRSSLAVNRSVFVVHTAHFDMTSINKFLFDYEAQLMELVTENHVRRFLTSNRVRKKLELLNSNLHTEVSKIFLRLRTDRRPSASGRGVPAGAARSASSSPAPAATSAPDDTVVRQSARARACVCVCLMRVLCRHVCWPNWSQQRDKCGRRDSKE